MSDTVLGIVIVIGLTLVTAFGALFFKRGASKIDANIFHQLRNIDLFIGVFLYTALSPLYLYALKLADLSIIYPITSLTYVWVPLISMRFLHERMNLSKWCGIACIVIGVIVITHASV